MKKYFVLIVLTLVITPLFSQNLPKLLNQANWQQNVNYDIKVELNTRSNSLLGFEKMTYTNNSPNTLDKIYIHLIQYASLIFFVCTGYNMMLLRQNVADVSTAK